MDHFRRAESETATAAKRLLIGFVLMAGVFGLGCGGSSTHQTPPEYMLRPRATGVATPPLKVGEALPTLQSEGWLNGNPPSPDSPGVRLLVIDVWGSWCPYCAKAAPGLLSLYEKYKSQGVAFVSLTSSDEDFVANYIKKHAVPWPNGYGASSQAVGAIGAGSGMLGPVDYEVTPTLYLVGRDGHVRWTDGRGRAKHQETQAWLDAVDAAIADALAPPQPPKP